MRIRRAIPVVLGLGVVVAMLMPTAAVADHVPTNCQVVVCATSGTFARVICSRPAPLTVQCTGGGGWGGGGSSPFGIPGRATWSGSASCGADCSGSRSVSRSCSWAGLGANGCGGADEFAFPTVLRFNIFRTCITYTVSSSASTTAEALLSVSASDTSSDSDSMCNY